MTICSPYALIWRKHHWDSLSYAEERQSTLYKVSIITISEFIYLSIIFNDFKIFIWDNKKNAYNFLQNSSNNLCHA